MKIKLTVDIPVGAECGLNAGLELEAVIVDDEVWVEAKNGEIVKILRREYEVINVQESSPIKTRS